MTEPIRQRSVLEVVLLNTLAEHADGISTSDAYEWIAGRYSFPEDWYRELPMDYDKLRDLGYGDWRSIPQEKLVELVPTELQWRNELRWARNTLRKRGHLDANAPKGTWRLTSAGMKAAGRIALESLAPEERRIATPRPRPPQAAIVTTGIRESLMAKLTALTSSMPTDDLDMLVDIARVVRTRSLTDRRSA